VLIQNPTATFLWRMAGDCMIDWKNFYRRRGDRRSLLVPRHRSLVLAIIDSAPQRERLNERGYRLQDISRTINEHTGLADVDQACEAWRRRRLKTTVRSC
jgi:hypothetical protein